MSDKTSINERIKKIVNYTFNGNTSAMARATFIKQATLRDIISEKVKPSYETIKAIVECPTLRISSEWLITGEGLMLESGESYSRKYIDPNKIEQLLTVDDKTNNDAIAERFRETIRISKLSKQQFAECIGLTTGILSAILSGQMPINSNIQSKISSQFKINIDWLVTGEGPMLKSEALQPTEKTLTSGNTIKYYPSVNGSMGGIEFLDDPDELSTDIILPGFSECKFAVNAYGDSMYPVIKSGQIVIMMAWTERFIDWGHIYMVVTKSGYRAIKYLKPSAKKGFVTCESENKENNPAFEIEMEDIHRLYLVKGWICRDVI